MTKSIWRPTYGILFKMIRIDDSAFPQRIGLQKIVITFWVILCMGVSSEYLVIIFAIHPDTSGLHGKTSRYSHWRIQGGKKGGGKRAIRPCPFQSYAVANTATFLFEAAWEHDKNIPTAENNLSGYRTIILQMIAKTLPVSEIETFQLHDQGLCL